MDGTLCWLLLPLYFDDVGSSLDVVVSLASDVGLLPPTAILLHMMILGLICHRSPPRFQPMYDPR